MRRAPIKTERPPSIRIYQPNKLGGQYIGDISQKTDRYRQAHKLNGGCWTATWDMINQSPGSMRNFFKRRIGCHIECYSGGVKIWEGLIWSMDMTQKGVVRRITLDTTRNAIKCFYTNVSDDSRSETGWYSNDSSIARYGRIEEVVYLDKTATATAEAYAQTVLAESQIPIPTIVAIKEPKEEDEVTLRVSAVGYAYTLNYQFLSIADSTVSISTAISSVLSTNSDFVTAGSIATNATQVRPPNTETKAWDWLVELAEIGDGTNPYLIQVLNDRRLFYKKLEPDPTLKWDGKKLTTWAGRNLSAGKWSARPGIIRDLTWDNIPLPAEYFLLNQRDSFVDEIEASVEYAIPLLKSSDQPDANMIVALTRATNALDRK